MLGNFDKKTGKLKHIPPLKSQREITSLLIIHFQPPHHCLPTILHKSQHIHLFAYGHVHFSVRFLSSLQILNLIVMSQGRKLKTLSSQNYILKAEVQIQHLEGGHD